MIGIEELLAGRTLAGRYRMLEVARRESAEIVYRATDEHLGREVALRVPRQVADREIRARFRARALAAAALQNPHVIRVYDIGQDDRIWVCFAVEEAVDGTTLEEATRSDELSTGDLLDLLEGVVAGMAAAHRAGVVLGPIRPREILLGSGSARISAISRADGDAPAWDAQRDVREAGLLGWALLAEDTLAVPSSADVLRARGVSAPVAEVIVRACASDSGLHDAAQLDAALRAARAESSHAEGVIPVAPAADAGGFPRSPRVRRHAALLGAAVLLFGAGTLAPEWSPRPPVACGPCRAATPEASPLQAPRALPASALDSALERIRTEYGVIENGRTEWEQRIVRLEDGHTSDPLVAYIDTSGIRKIAATWKVGPETITERYYYHPDATLFFVFRTRERLGIPRQENRFYFADGRLIRWRRPDQQLIAPSDPMYPREELALLQLSRELRRTVAGNARP